MKTIVLLLSAIAGISQLALAAPDRPAVRAQKTQPIEIVQINPSQGDIKHVEAKLAREGAKSSGPAQVHVVKLYVDMPEPGAEPAVLYIGDEKISEYGSFTGGIFVKVYDPKQLQSWEGKPVRMLYKNEMIDLGITFPSKPTGKPSKLPDAEEALKN